MGFQGSSVDTVFCETTESSKAGKSFGRTVAALGRGKGVHAPCEALRICLTLFGNCCTLSTRSEHHERGEDGKEDESEFLHLNESFQSPGYDERRRRLEGE